MAVGTISTKLAEWLLVALIGFTLFFEVVLHKFEHWINHKHQHLQAVTRVLYRELMVLGLISFCFILYETIAKPTGDVILSFEFAHVFIFLLAIFYTVVTVCAMITSLRLSKRWKDMEQIDLVRYLRLKDKYSQYRLQIHKHKGSYWQLFHWWFPNIKSLFSYWDLHELMAFHDIRFQVIYYRNLAEHFRFASFLRKIKSATFLELVEIHWSLYAIFLVIILADITRRSLTRTDTLTTTATKFAVRAVEKATLAPVDYEVDIAESVFLISASGLLLVFCQVLAGKIRKIYWELTKHPRVYYENLEPTALSEEIEAVVQNRKNQERARRRSLSEFTGDVGILADDEATDTNEPNPNSLRTPTPEPSASQDSKSPELEMLSEISGVENSAERATLKYSSAKRRDNSMAGPSNGGSRVNSSVRSFDQPGSADRYIQPPSRTSVEYRTRVRSDMSSVPSDNEGSYSRGSLEHGGSRNDLNMPLPDPSLPLELHDTARRHSLDLTRAVPVPSPVAVPALVMRPSSVAQQAVAAARRRSIEGAPVGRRVSSELSGSAFDRRYSTELEREDGARRSMDMNGRRSIGSRSRLSRSSRRGSVEDDSRTTLGFRNSLDSGRRRSIELAAAMPHEEIMQRHHASSVDLERDGEQGIMGNSPLSAGFPDRSDGRGAARARYGTAKNMESSSGTGESSVSSRQQNSFFRQKSLALLNATILKNLELQEKARNTEPAYYPRVVRKLIPRLGRVASPIEKLFWFGSHKFFLWCVEFTMFFSSVIVASAFASLSLLLLYKRPMTTLNIVSFVLPLVTLLFVLFRIAGIIKKYIFIIHNASLVPEAIAIEAIHTAAKKGPVVRSFEVSDDSGDEAQGSEDREAEQEKRQKLARYFRSEAELGNVRGIEATDAVRISDEESASARRAKKRSILLKLRNRRGEESKESKESKEELPV